MHEAGGAFFGRDGWALGFQQRSHPQVGGIMLRLRSMCVVDVKDSGFGVCPGSDGQAFRTRQHLCAFPEDRYRKEAGVRRQRNCQCGPCRYCVYTIETLESHQ